MILERGITIGLVVMIGYIGWLVTCIFLYCERRKKNKFEEKIKSLEKEG